MPQNGTNIAKRLVQQVPEIMRQWELRVRAAVPAAQHETKPNLFNNVPLFLNELVRVLASKDKEVPSGLQSTIEHAEHRANLPAYSLPQVIREYSLLRDSILDVLAPVQSDELRTIIDIVDLGIRESSTHYVKVQATALRESEERFRLLVANVKDYAIFMLDPEGYIMSWNAGAERIKGYTADEVLGKHFSMFYMESDIRDGKPEHGLRTATEKGHFEGGGLRVRKDGSTFFADVLITAVRDESGKLRGLAKITRDITERRALEAELHKRADELAETNRRKDEFLAMLGHELRNPLASIINSMEVLRLASSKGSDTEQVQDIIERQGKHLARLVDDLLDVARINLGKIELSKKPVELTQLVEQVADSLRPLIAERQQSLDISLPDTCVWLQADASRLSQVLGNLLHNAAKFTQRGGRIEIHTWIENREAVIQVRDNGMGISTELLPKVFDVFTQGDRSHDRSASGLGIGLSLVKTLVEMHNGTVAARSNGPGTGSEFLVRMPLLDAAAAEVKAHDQATPADRRGQRPVKRVLVVDDNVDAAASVATLLKLCQHSVRVVHTGQEAIQAVGAEHPEVVLLDIGLPDIDGYEVAHQLRARPEFNDVQLIALTGYGQTQDRRRSQEAGFDAHLTKPADLAALQSAIAAQRER